MPTYTQPAEARLPERPDLDQLRRRARELQRAVRAGDPSTLDRLGLAAADPTFGLSRAQHALARAYGFPSWTRLQRQVTAIGRRSWTLGDVPAEESRADRLLRLGCLTYTSDDPLHLAVARELLAEEPELAGSGMLTAAACGQPVVVRRALERDRSSATRTGGPYGWSPLLYLCFSRLAVDEADTLECARLLLAGGADPNDGRFFSGLPTPFTALSGVLGNGEGDQPVHPFALPLARLLLGAGADPNDGQALYNRMFSAEDDFLRVLFEFGLGRGDGGPWRRLLPDLVDPPAVLLDKLLDWAVTHDQLGRVELLARHGVDLDRPASGPLMPPRRPIELALLTGNPRLAHRLTELGAAPADLGPVEAFLAAALAAEPAAADAPSALVTKGRRLRPGAIVWAAGLRRPAAVRLLAGHGFDLNALSRSDVPIEQPWQTPLHTAVERDDPETLRLLLELGADTHIRDRRFHSTPRDWAVHLDRPRMLEFLA